MKYLFLLILLCLYSCKENKSTSANDNKYFEGIVEYSTTYSGDSSRTLIYMKKHFGSYQKTFIKEKRIGRFYYNEHNIILSREIQNLDSLKDYEWIGESDTVKVVDLEKANFLSAVDMKEVAPKTIAGIKCKGVMFTMEMYMLFGGSSTTYYSTYYFDTTHLLRPDLYKKVRLGSIGEIFSRYPYVTLGYHNYYPDEKLHVYSMADKIIPTKLDNVHFELPKKSVFVNAFGF